MFISLHIYIIIINDPLQRYSGASGCIGVTTHRFLTQPIYDFNVLQIQNESVGLTKTATSQPTSTKKWKKKKHTCSIAVIRIIIIIQKLLPKTIKKLPASEKKLPPIRRDNLLVWTNEWEKQNKRENFYTKYDETWISIHIAVRSKSVYLSKWLLCLQSGCVYFSTLYLTLNAAQQSQRYIHFQVA